MAEVAPKWTGMRREAPHAVAVSSTNVVAGEGASEWILANEECVACGRRERDFRVVIDAVMEPGRWTTLFVIGARTRRSTEVGEVPLRRKTEGAGVMISWKAKKLRPRTDLMQVQIGLIIV